jgi:hypothetical protein
MSEACDLGVRLVQSNARSIWRTFTPVYLAVAVVALATFEIAPWLPTLIIFWLKPWLDRSLLFALSRAVFGTPTGFMDLWAAQRSVWWQGLLRALTLSRLSRMRAFVLPVQQLEGQRGSDRRKRVTQIAKGHTRAALWMHLAFAHVEMFLVLGLMSLAAWMTPDGGAGSLFEWIRHADDADAVNLQFVSSLAYAVVVLALEPFYAAAGFAMYLNRRVELEAWDIEQEFRRAFS